MLIHERMLFLDRARGLDSENALRGAEMSKKNPLAYQCASYTLPCVGVNCNSSLSILRCYFHGLFKVAFQSAAPNFLSFSRIIFSLKAVPVKQPVNIELLKLLTYQFPSTASLL